MFVTSGGPGIYTGSELNQVIRGKLEEGLNFGVSDKKTGKELFRFSIIDRSIDWSTGLENVARDAAERLGLIQISTEFYPSSSSQDLAVQWGIKFDDHRDSRWSGWFMKIAKDGYIVPDTNILLKRTLTSIILPKFGTTVPPFRVAIPRLAILELESLANEGQKRQRASKGECFMAFNEVRLLKEKGATLTQPLSSDLMSSFYAIAGKRLTDAFLREEIRSFGESLGVDRAIFLTRDMVSALAANSEDLDAIYMAPKYPDQTSLGGLGIALIRELLIEVATDRSEVVLKWQDGTEIGLEGVWSGKNWYDYYRRRARVTVS